MPDPFATPDRFATMADSADLPSREPYAVVPSDTVPLPVVPRGLYVGGGGDVRLRGIDGREDVTYRNLPDASYVAVRAAFVRATGTTATAIVAEA